MKLKKYISIILCSILIISSSFVMSYASDVKKQDLNYSESTVSLNNPDRGFYIPRSYNMNLSDNQIKNYPYNLVHLRVGIGCLSEKYNNDADYDFTDNMLLSLRGTLENFRKSGSCVILRFAYDNFYGYADKEPSIEIIERHIAQLAPVFCEYSDVITCVEAGFIGPWGEMHTSALANKTDFNRLISALLSAVPDNLTLSVRRPLFYANFFGVNINSIDSDVSLPDTEAYRVGIFNDGYLGSSSDFGTFVNREKEVTWLQNQALHTIYGGEVVAAAEPGYNTVDYICTEMFRTHTSYLNSAWNDTVINTWKNTVYSGSDEVYSGCTGYQYINNHLGYRYVLRNSEISDTLLGGDELSISIAVENVGCGNMVNRKIAAIIISDDDNTYYFPVEIDCRNWNSLEITQENITVTLPDTFAAGVYKVYLRALPCEV